MVKTIYIGGTGEEHYASIQAAVNAGAITVGDQITIVNAQGSSVIVDDLPSDDGLDITFAGNFQAGSNFVMGASDYVFQDLLTISSQITVNSGANLSVATISANNAQNQPISLRLGTAAPATPAFTFQEQEALDTGSFLVTVTAAGWAAAKPGASTYMLSGYGILTEENFNIDAVNALPYLTAPYALISTTSAAGTSVAMTRRTAGTDMILDSSYARFAAGTEIAGGSYILGLDAFGNSADLSGNLTNAKTLTVDGIFGSSNTDLALGTLRADGLTITAENRNTTTKPTISANDLSAFGGDLTVNWTVWLQMTSYSGESALVVDFDGFDATVLDSTKVYSIMTFTGDADAPAVSFVNTDQLLDAGWSFSIGTSFDADGDATRGVYFFDANTTSLAPVAIDKAAWAERCGGHERHHSRQICHQRKNHR